MRTDDVLAQIGEALDDWAVGPDAMRCGAPPGAAHQRFTHHAARATTLLLTVDVRPFVEAMKHAVEQITELMTSLHFTDDGSVRAVDRHHPRPLPIDGVAYHRRRSGRSRR